MLAKLRLTLRQVFGFSLLGLLLGLSLLFYLVFDGSQRTILQSSERFRDFASQVVARSVTGYLDEAPMAVAHFEEQVQYALIDPKNLDSLQHGLLSLLLANQNISEATMTSADPRSFGPGAHPPPDPAFSIQIALLRSSREGEFVRKLTWFDGARFVSDAKTIGPSINPPGPAPTPLPAADPTLHLTFQTAANKFYGQLIATDLHWSQIDETLPELQRRVEVSVQKTIEDSHGHFAGVLRIGLMKMQIDGAVRQHITAADQPDPHLIFLCDNEGRLITGFGRQDHVTVSGDDLRIAPGDVPPVVAAALREPALKEVGDAHPVAAASYRFGKAVYLCTFRALPGTQGWIAGIVVPRDFYLGDLLRIRRQVLRASFAMIAAIILLGSLIVRAVVRAQSLILRETARMNAFEFSPASNPSRLRDVQEVLLGMEKAKTAMRAMSKYVPVDLVRRLYHEGQEPALGGKSVELSVLFTDIRDFTAFSEKMAPDEVARLLGLYLQAITGVIQSQKGTIDKFIGDAVMAFWNAPETVPSYEMLACRAALRSRVALRALYDSAEWGRAPRFETRFGLHRCVASVGHFGAPDRFNYTAIGDGINLASRLEKLNKHYGTSVIASETIHSAVKDRFEFRLLDRVAVKGKTEGVTVYELIGEKSSASRPPDYIQCYEQAFEFYQRAHFEAALAILERQSEDPPSRILETRCRDLIANPPATWDGIHIFDSK